MFKNKNMNESTKTKIENFGAYLLVLALIAAGVWIGSVMLDAVK